MTERLAYRVSEVAELLTLDEVATILRVSRRSVERLVSQGRIRVVHPTPGRTAVTPTEVKAYVASLSRAA